MEYQSCLNPLSLVESMGLCVTWKLICMGLYGNEEIPAQVSKDEICTFLEKKLEEKEFPNDEILLICNKENDWEFDLTLKELEKKEAADYSLELRKWRVYMLKKILDNPNTDTLQGLLELMEFWIYARNDIDCPHIFPSNDVPFLQVENYFTPKMYKFLVNKNREWLLKEIQSIIDIQTR